VCSDGIDHVAILIALALPILGIVVVIAKTTRYWVPQLRSLPKWRQALAVVGVGVAVMFGGTKSPPPVIPGTIADDVDNTSGVTVTVP
jgi:hypothetical protein